MRYQDNKGESFEIKAGVADDIQRLMEMYTTFELRGHYQGIPPINLSTSLSWITHLLRQRRPILSIFLHAADLHLDSPLRGLQTYDGAPDIEDIRSATRQALIRMVDYTIEEQIPLVLIAGDLYDGDWPDFGTGLFFAQQMNRLSQNGIRVAIVSGNHDAENKMTKSLPMPANVTFFSAKKPETVLYEDLKIAVHGQGYDLPETTRNLAVNYPDPVAGMFNIGLLHCLIAGSAGHKNYAPCTLDDLAAKGYDYWALGHVHEYKVLRENPLIVYPGCTQGRHVKETGRKGCVVVDAADGDVSHTFVPLGSVQWGHLAVDVSTCETPRQAAESAVEALTSEMADSDSPLCCVRMVFQGRTLLHNHLVLHNAQVTATLQALVAEAFGQRVWLEKVLVQTGPKLDMDAVAQSDTPLGELLRFLQDLETTEVIELDFTPLRSKLAGTHIDVPPEDDPELLKGAKAILSSLLNDMQALEGPR